MSFDFVRNNLLFYVGVFVSLFVIAQSLFFIKLAYDRGRELGLEGSLLKRTIFQSAVFSILPSFAILLTVVTLSKALGLNLPWIRLSVIGAITYEVPAATSAAGVYGQSIGSVIDDPVIFSNVAWVMTVGSLVPLILIPLFLDKIQAVTEKFRKKDEKFSDVFMNAIFMGMVSSFLGYGIAGSESNGIVYGSVISILCLIVSALAMVFCGYLINNRKMKWVENFAMPFSMLVSMGMAIVFYNVLPASVSSWTIPGIL